MVSLGEQELQFDEEIFQFVCAFSVNEDGLAPAGEKWFTLLVDENICSDGIYFSMFSMLGELFRTRWEKRRTHLAGRSAFFVFPKQGRHKQQTLADIERILTTCFLRRIVRLLHLLQFVENLGSDFSVGSFVLQGSRYMCNVCTAVIIVFNTVP